MAARDASHLPARRRVGMTVACIVSVIALLAVAWVGVAGGERTQGAAATRRPAARWTRHATSVTLVGDSLAASLADGLTAAARPLGITAVSRAVDGCGVVRGTAADDRFRPFPWTATCDAVVPGILDDVAAQAPSLVLWLSSWETANRLVDGREVRFGTPHGDRVMLRLVDGAVRRLTAHGSRVVFLTLPHRTTRPGLVGEFFGTPYPVDAESADERRSVDRINALQRRYVAEHPRRATLVDLDAMVCGNARPCRFTVDGVALRPEDGRHFAGAGPEWVGRRIFERLGLAAAAR